jgi:hypothetical protein
MKIKRFVRKTTWLLWWWKTLVPKQLCRQIGSVPRDRHR